MLFGKSAQALKGCAVICPAGSAFPALGSKVPVFMGIGYHNCAALWNRDRPGDAGREKVFVTIRNFLERSHFYSSYYYMKGMIWF